MDCGKGVPREIGESLRMAIPELYKVRCCSRFRIHQGREFRKTTQRSQRKGVPNENAFGWSGCCRILVLLDQLSACDPYSTFAGRQTLVSPPFGCGFELHSKFGTAY